MNTGKIHPPALTGSSMAYDPKDGYVVLFGGYSTAGYWGSGNVTNATWIYSGGLWTLLSTAVAPGPRAYASMTYDPAIGSLVLFGGIGQTTCAVTGCSSPQFNDTWTFGSGKWTQLRPAQSPQARFGAGMTFDPRVKALILEAGITNGNASDTWMFSAGTWTLVALGCATFQPPWSRGVVSTYDRADKELVALTVYGPQYTFVFSKGCWTQYFTHATYVGPGALSFDPRLNSTVYFSNNATWGYNAGVWASGFALHSPSDLSYEPMMAYDTASRCMVVFGAGNNSTETWVLK